MSVFDRDGQTDSITDMPRARSLFTDRHETVRLFMERIHKRQVWPILWLRGAGGNGKTLLLDFIRQRCSRKLSDGMWEYLQSRPPEELGEFVRNEALTSNAEQVPTAMLDFSTPQDREPLEALLHLRVQLLPFGLRFPRFEFTALKYLELTGRPIAADDLKKLFDPAWAGVLAPVIEAASDHFLLKLGSAALQAIAGSLVEKGTDHVRTFQMTPGEVAEVKAARTPAELLDLMPKMFGRDLVAAAADGHSVVLLFDSHHEFSQGHHDESDYAIHRRDQWLRILLGHCVDTPGVVSVVTSRESSLWKTAPRGTRFPEECLEDHVLGNLTRSDAQSYLRKAGVHDQQAIQTLLSFTEVEPDQHHPLYLGLCVDLVLAMEGQPFDPGHFNPDITDKGTALVERLLGYLTRDVEHSVGALSAARWFDEELYRYLGSEVGFQQGSANWETVTRFSFVHGGEASPYHIHDLVGRILRAQKNAQVMKAHKALAEYYGNKAREGQVAALVEAIYHQFEVDPDMGAAVWAAHFMEARERSQFHVCGALLSIRDLVMSTSTKMAAGGYSLEGAYLLEIGDYQAAEQCFLDAANLFGKAASEVDGEEAAGLLNDRAVALQEAGSVQARLLKHEAALATLKEAASVLAAALAQSTDPTKWEQNGGVILRLQADSLAALGQASEAVALLREAEQLHIKGLTAQPEETKIRNNLVTVRKSLGLVYERLGRPLAALMAFHRAIAGYREIISMEQGKVSAARYNLGLTYRDLGMMLAKHGELMEAESQFHRAVATFADHVKCGGESPVETLNDVAVTRRLHARALFQAEGETNSTEAVVRSLILINEAIRIWDLIQRDFPGHVGALVNAAGAHFEVSMLKASMRDLSGAIESCEASTTLYERCREHPEFSEGMRENYIGVLVTLAHLREQSGDVTGAEADYRRALQEADSLLTMTPGNRSGQLQSISALISFGTFLKKQGRKPEAAKCLRKALHEIDQIRPYVDKEELARLTAAQRQAKADLEQIEVVKVYVNQKSRSPGMQAEPR